MRPGGPALPRFQVFAAAPRLGAAAAEPNPVETRVAALPYEARHFVAVRRSSEREMAPWLVVAVAEPHGTPGRRAAPWRAARGGPSRAVKGAPWLREARDAPSREARLLHAVLVRAERTRRRSTRSQTRPRETLQGEHRAEAWLPLPSLRMPEGFNAPAQKSFVA